MQHLIVHNRLSYRRTHDARAEVKRTSTGEANVSQRTIRYDLYVDGKYSTTFTDVNKAIEERDRINGARDAEGFSNVTNVGTCHLGRSGAGSQAACGNNRAAMTFSKEKFSQLSEESRCKRCNGIFERRQANKDQAISPVAGEAGTQSIASYMGKALEELRKRAMKGVVVFGGAHDELRKCPRCRGTGEIMVRGMDRPTRCPRCKGTGKVEAGDSAKDARWEVPYDVSSGTRTVSSSIDVTANSAQEAESKARKAAASKHGVEEGDVEITSNQVKRVGDRAKDDNFPFTVSYKGKTYHKTGKTGTNFASGEASAEYEAEGGGARLWRLASGKLQEDGKRMRARAGLRDCGCGCGGKGDCH